VTARTTDELLARVPLFAGLSKKDLRVVAKLATGLHLKAGSELTHQGASGHEFIIVLGGTVDVLIDGEVVATCGAGDFFGEMALFEDGKRVATVVAKTDVDVEVISRREFSALLIDYPQIGDTLRAAMEKRVTVNAARRDEGTSTHP
jgi:CRP/FNR family cyclic AMP-dependent transcriptional regulator